MTEFLAIVTAFPTVLFTGALLLSGAYWALAVVGAIDLDGHDAAADGAIDGALDGHVDAALDGHLDAALDGHLDSVGDAVEHAASAAHEALHRVADAVEHVHSPDEGGIGLGPVWIAQILGLGKVPLTVFLSLFTFWGWISAFLLSWGFRHVVTGVPELVGGGVSFVGAVGIATVLGRLSSMPLEPLFRTIRGRERRSVVGEVCEVRTDRVDGGFGQATADLNGDDLIFQIRCDTPGNGLGRGGRALIVSYDEVREAFVVEPMSSPRAVAIQRKRDAAPHSREHHARDQSQREG